jgi:hypothetical protein
MADFQLRLDGVVDSLLRIPLPDSATGLVLGNYLETVSENGVFVGDPVVDLGLGLLEVDSVDAPGLYQLQLTPRVAGTLYVQLVRGGDRFMYTVQVSEPTFSDAALEGDYTVTVDDGSGPVPGAIVRVFDAAGTRLVQRGVSDALGQVTFYGLPTGNYQVRAYKDGVDFSSVNPTTITVVPNQNELPVASEVLPVEGSIGEVLVVSGTFFDPDDMQVQFGAEATVAADYVNAAGTLLLVTVPTLTGTVFALRVDKEDPGSPPARLSSNALTWVRV